nr:DNA polymerase kappa isoform X2 [Coffea arabica]
MAEISKSSESSLVSASDACCSELKPWESYHTAYTNAKAGMEGVDKERVQRIVYEMSKGSKYFENEERKEACMMQKIENMRARSAKLTAADLSHYQKVADKKILELEAHRDLSRIWLHVDMDAFYAAVETLCNPALQGKPMAVGSMSMISTANYEARKFGVRAAMPGFIARKLCPQLIFVPVDFKKYTHYSELTRKVFYEYDPTFLGASLDEAYLDITNVCQERGITGAEVAEELRKNVYNETGLTCSAGVAPNRLLAKVCSDINKPNGQFVLQNDRMAVMTFISSLPIRKIGGIGKVTEQILKNVFGITTCEEMLQKSSFLCALFSRSSSDFFFSVALGLGGTDTPQIRFRKSISNERTFSATGDEELLHKKIVDLAEMLSADMRKEGISGKTLTLKLKTASFEVRTRAVTLPNFISSSEDILKHASKLLKAELPVSLRLIGLRMSQFSDDKNDVPSDPTQRTLSNYVIPGGPSRSNINDSMQLGSEISDSAFSIDTDGDFPIDSHERCSESVDASNYDQMTNVPVGNCILGQKTEEVWSNVELPTNEDNEPSIVGKSVKPFANGDSLPVKRDPFLGGFDGSRGHTSENRIHHEDLNAGFSSHQRVSFFWAEDYKCSICGVELPPSFVEERQEHSDFHLAERLQEEESGDNVISLTVKPSAYWSSVLKSSMCARLVQREHTIKDRKTRKRQKPSPAGGKHVPIDVYFAKTSQNF